MTANTADLPASEALHVSKLVDYGDGAIVSRTIVKKETGNITLFALDAGQSISEHTTPFDALVQVLDGSSEIVIDGSTHAVSTGQAILMPANIPHALHAKVRFKMMLTMIKS